jgi:molecular chaperone GrpE
MSDEHEFPEAEDGAEESLDQTIERLEAEIGEWKDHALRAAAEAENVRRRAEREMNDARAFAIQRFAKDLFGVADNLQRALQAAPKDAADPALKNLSVGIELVEKELLGAFERNGLKRLDPAAGEKFDPNLHQAVMEQPSDTVAAGGVIQVLQTGYELFGRVLRPAMVVVAAKGSGDSARSPSAEAAGQSAYAKAAEAAANAEVDRKA